MNHTPGPWECFQSRRKECWYAGPKYQTGLRDGTYLEADAHLIASAPELLNAYKEIWIVIEDGLLETAFFELREKFRRLTAKAEGKKLQ